MCLEHSRVLITGKPGLRLGSSETLTSSIPWILRAYLTRTECNASRPARKQNLDLCYCTLTALDFVVHWSRYGPDETYKPLNDNHQRNQTASTFHKDLRMLLVKSYLCAQHLWLEHVDSVPELVAVFIAQNTTYALR